MRISIFTLCFLLISLAACKKKGCTDPTANNYNPSAEVNDGSCDFSATRQVLSYGPDPVQQLELYLPAGHNNSTKVILMLHGGGWVVGYNTDAKVTTFSGRYGWDILNPLLNEGYACAVMKYRTACYRYNSDDATLNTTLYYDQMMEDIDLAITHLKSNAGILEIADNHYQLLGESAGGHLVLSYALRSASDSDLKSAASMFGPTALDDSEWKLTLHQLDSAVSEGLDVKGINYLRTDESDCALTTNKNISLLGELRSFGDHDTIHIFSPNSYLQTLSPASPENLQTARPIFIMHGDNDELVPHSQAAILFDAYTDQFPDATVCGESEFDGMIKKTIYADCGHGWTGGSCQRLTVMSDIVEWMNAH